MIFGNISNLDIPLKFTLLTNNKNKYSFIFDNDIIYSFIQYLILDKLKRYTRFMKYLLF